MVARKVLRYLGYAVSTTLFLTGILIIAGYLVPSYIPSNFRVLFGVVLVLYGVFRFVSLRVRKPINEEFTP